MLSPVHAPEQIEQEDELNSSGDQGRDCDEAMQWNQAQQKVVAENRVAAWIAGEPEQMHWHEDAIDAEESKPEMNVSKALAQHSSKHLRIPEVNRGEDGEDGRDSHDHMQVTDHEIRGMQIRVYGRMRQQNPAEPSGDKG